MMFECSDSQRDPGVTDGGLQRSLMGGPLI